MVCMAVNAVSLYGETWLSCQGPKRESNADLCFASLEEEAEEEFPP